VGRPPSTAPSTGSKGVEVEIEIVAAAATGCRVSPTRMPPMVSWPRSSIPVPRTIPSVPMRMAWWRHLSTCSRCPFQRVAPVSWEPTPLGPAGGVSGIPPLPSPISSRLLCISFLLPWSSTKTTGHPSSSVLPDRPRSDARNSPLSAASKAALAREMSFCSGYARVVGVGSG